MMIPIFKCEFIDVMKHCKCCNLNLENLNKIKAGNQILSDKYCKIYDLNV